MSEAREQHEARAGRWLYAVAATGASKRAADAIREGRDEDALEYLTAAAGYVRLARGVAAAAIREAKR